MELSYIKELWSKNVNTDRTQENNTWDSYVRDCDNDDSVNFENNSFLKFIQSATVMKMNSQDNMIWFSRIIHIPLLILTHL